MISMFQFKYNQACVPWSSIASLDTKFSKLTLLKVTSKGSKNAFNESTGIILSGVSPLPSQFNPWILAMMEKAPSTDRIKAYHVYCRIVHNLIVS